MAPVGWDGDGWGGGQGDPIVYERVTVLGVEKDGVTTRYPAQAGTYRWYCQEHGRSFATFRTATEAMEGYAQHIEREHG